MMVHSHSLLEASRLADSLDDDGPGYSTVRELRIQLHALLKDAEAAS